MADLTQPFKAQQPRVSVVIPAFNAAGFIRGTLASVFAQSFRDFEVVLVNDGSDDTRALRAAIAGFTEHIVYIEQENGGPSAARNRGIEAARGEYIALLDSDDEWLPGFLDEQMRFVERHPNTDLVYADGVVIGETPLAGRRLMQLSPSRGPVTFDSLVRERCTVLTSCTLARRSALLRAGLFDPRFRRSEDFHLWLRMAFGGARLACHPRVLARHRRRAGSLASDSAAMMRAFVSVLEDLRCSLPLSPGQQNTVRRQILMRSADIALAAAREHFLAARDREALEALDEACRGEPRVTQWLRLRGIRAAVAAAPCLLRRAYQRRRRPATFTAVSERA